MQSKYVQIIIINFISVIFVVGDAAVVVIVVVGGGVYQSHYIWMRMVRLSYSKWIYFDLWVWAIGSSHSIPNIDNTTQYQRGWLRHTQTHIHTLWSEVIANSQRDHHMCGCVFVTVSLRLFSMLWLIVISWVLFFSLVQTPHRPILHPSFDFSRLLANIHARILSHRPRMIVITIIIIRWCASSFFAVLLSLLCRVACFRFIYWLLNLQTHSTLHWLLLVFFLSLFQQIDTIFVFASFCFRNFYVFWNDFETWNQMRNIELQFFCERTAWTCCAQIK